ncbi:MAG TPA: thioredoxin domain-containing protein [Longimicrobiales bacterium]
MIPTRWKRSMAAAAGVAACLWAAACGGTTGEDAKTDPTASSTRQSTERTARPDRIGYDLGAAGAPITVVEFSDFGCPYCGRFALETFPVLRREYIETGKVAWRYVPFVLGSFPNGAEAARAAECAAEQGEDRFWAMHDALYRRQREWKSTREPEALFRGLAETLALDVDRFSDCYDADRGARRTRMANGLAAYAGIRATPTFFINGQRVQGALPLEHFRMIFDAMLAR